MKNRMLQLNGQKEAKFKDAFFRGQTFNEGIEMAGIVLCISQAEALNYFMTYDPVNPHDITSSYIFACRYKRLYDDGFNCIEIAQSLGHKSNVVSCSVKVAKIFGPADIKTDLVFSDYQKAAYADNPKVALNEIRNAKRKKATDKVGQLGKKDVKEQFIAQSKMAYKMQEEGVSLLEIAKAFGVSQKQANVLSEVGALPQELMQLCKPADIKKAIQANSPESYLKYVIKEGNNTEPHKNENMADKNQRMLAMTSENIGAEELQRFAAGILNILVENKKVQNQNEIMQRMSTENIRLRSLISGQKEEIANLRKQNRDLQKDKKRADQLRNKVNELKQLISK